MIIDENLEPVAVIVDCNGGVFALECTHKGLSHFGAPAIVIGVYAVEHERVFSSPDGNMKESISPLHNVDVGIIVSAWGRGKVKGGGLEDNDSPLLELVFGLYRPAYVKKMLFVPQAPGAGPLGPNCRCRSLACENKSCERTISLND